jgi:hypothetical protein
MKYLSLAILGLTLQVIQGFYQQIYNGKRLQILVPKLKQISKIDDEKPSRTVAFVQKATEALQAQFRMTYDSISSNSMEGESGKRGEEYFAAQVIKCNIL